MSFPNGVAPTTERVHPTPIYEFFIWMLIAVLLWRIGKRALSGEAPGKVFCAYLISTGVARFLIEFIRINPRSFFGMSNAQTASLVSIIVGFLLFWRARTRSPLP
jgi:phosphatidylglycerol:prolipoprotein diacylglycerol transferase